MTSYLAYSIYAYIGSLTSWRIEKMYRNQNDDRQIKTWLVLKNVFRVTGTALLIAHLMSQAINNVKRFTATGNKNDPSQSLTFHNQSETSVFAKVMLILNKNYRSQ